MNSTNILNLLNKVHESLEDAISKEKRFSLSKRTQKFHFTQPPLNVEEMLQLLFNRVSFCSFSRFSLKNNKSENCRLMAMPLNVET
jgi:hypothetical protein